MCDVYRILRVVLNILNHPFPPTFKYTTVLKVFFFDIFINISFSVYIFKVLQSFYALNYFFVLVDE